MAGKIAGRVERMRERAKNLIKCWFVRHSDDVLYWPLTEYNL